MHEHQLNQDLTLADLVAVARQGRPVSLHPDAAARVARAAQMVEELVAARRPVYGITTGFGKFSDVTISPEETAALQRNLLLSHACGVGPLLAEEEVRAMMLLRAQALAQGHSGVRPQTLDLLLAMLNKGVWPAVPEQGSLGASGDLAPLAHVCLPLIGEGEAHYQGRLMPAREALAQAGLQPVELAAKEGLALINGTQAMTAIGSLVLHDALQALKTAEIAAALTAEALRAIPAAWDERIQHLRRHAGQIASAGALRRLVAGSTLVTAPGELRTQDAYTLRCLPQVHGASRGALVHVTEILAGELNAVTDNPLLFPEDGAVISGGNFHGQPVALAMDYLGIALAELANISERRIERLVNPALSGLPAFLTAQGGLHSGLMIVQYSAASLVSENKVWAHPSSVDSIPSSANQEDHVSMGTTGARKARQILKNVQRVLAMELLCAAQALEFSDPRGLGAGTAIAYRMVRERVAPLREDRYLAPEIERLAMLIRSSELVSAVEGVVGEL